MEFILLSGNRITATATAGDKPARWNPSGNHYRVTIRANGKRATFDFWGSYADMVSGKRADIRGALACFASDVQLYKQARDIDDFAADLGYTKPSEAVSAYNGCKRAAQQADRLELSDEDLSELADY